MSTRLVDRLAARLDAPLPGTRLLPERAPALWPRIGGTLHAAPVTARVGRVLGICFGISFVTGMLSYYQYAPWEWLPLPAAPVWGYRLTQGTHVVTGIASIPLLLVKLWSVYPRLFAWPPARSLVEAAERVSIAVLVASSLVELTTGLLNIMDWYAWPWSFATVHRYLAYVVIGSLLLHIAVKLPVIRRALADPLPRPAAPLAQPAPLTRPAPAAGARPAGARLARARPARATPAAEADGLTRRGLVTATAAGVGLVVLTAAGQALTPLRRLALLSARQPDRGPLGVPINRLASQAGVTAADTSGSAWRLQVVGPVSFTVDLAELEAMPTLERSLPIACVEGWSVQATWRGVPLIDVVRRAGGSASSTVRVSSLQRKGAFGASTVVGPQVATALLATHLNGVRLPLDHGYPLRLIAPDRAGVHNTKWLQRIEVHG